MFLIQFLIPLYDNDNQPFPKNAFDQICNEMTDQFGGVTTFLRSPAKGVWKECNGKVNHDEVVMFEVMADRLDRRWWVGYRKELEQRFRQEELIIRSMGMERL